jgi:hypothetical protein
LGRKDIADHGAGRGDDAAAAHALDGAAQQQAQKLVDRAMTSEPTRKQRDAGHVDRPAAMAVTQAGQRCGAAQRAQDEHRHHQGDLAVVQIKAGAQRGNRRRDDRGVQRGHEHTDEQRRQQAAGGRRTGRRGIRRHQDSALVGKKRRIVGMRLRAPLITLTPRGGAYSASASAQMLSAQLSA